MGVVPHASQLAFATQSCLPAAVESLSARGIPLGAHQLHITHHGAHATTVCQTGVDQALEWEARFTGSHAALLVDGQPHPAVPRTLFGLPVSAVSVSLPPDRPVTVQTP